MYSKFSRIEKLEELYDKKGKEISVNEMKREYSLLDEIVVQRRGHHE